METGGGISLVQVIIPVTLVVFVISVGVVLLYLNYQRNLIRQQLTQEALKTAQQQELLKNSLFAQEEERKRIASDLHDEIGATLAILRMHLVEGGAAGGGEGGLAGVGSADGPAWAGGADLLVGLVNKAIDSVRQISHRLMPPQLESFGLVKTLESVTDAVDTSQSVEIDLVVSDGFPDGLPWPLSLGFYRVIMELVQNTLKHAQATSIRIELGYEAGWVVCRYCDDGCGISGMEAGAGEAEIGAGAEAGGRAGAGTGAGFKNIQARCSAMNGQFQHGNGDAGGFEAILKAPYP